jgi:hypothetical protein
MTLEHPLVDALYFVITIIHHTSPTNQLKSSHMKNSKILKRKRTSGSFSLQNFTTFPHHHSKKRADIRCVYSLNFMY